MQNYKKKDLVTPKTRAKILRRNAKRSATVKLGGADLRRGSGDNMLGLALGYKKLRSKTTSMNDPQYIARNFSNLANELLNEMGCSVINVPTTYSLLQEQTDKERITNPNIFDPQFATERAEKISPLTAYGEGDPFYVHDDKISRYKDLSVIVSAPPMASIASAGYLVGGMALSPASSGASLKYIM